MQTRKNSFRHYDQFLLKVQPLNQERKLSGSIEKYLQTNTRQKGLKQEQIFFHYFRIGHKVKVFHIYEYYYEPLSDYTIIIHISIFKHMI